MNPSNSSSSSFEFAAEPIADAFPFEVFTDSSFLLSGFASPVSPVAPVTPVAPVSTVSSPSSAREFIMLVRKRPLFPFANSRFFTSSIHLRSASSFRLYADVMNFSFPA